MKVLFIHGLASSGAYKTADTLRILLRPCEVIAPDVPFDPDEAFALLSSIVAEEHPDLVVGLSLGGFWAQKLRGSRKILINPDFHVSRLLRTMVGTQPWLSPRKDGATTFEVTLEACDQYEKHEKQQFEGLTPNEISRTRGMFADNDEIVHCADEFVLHYPGSILRYPGRHLPTFPELKAHLLPLATELLAMPAEE